MKRLFILNDKVAGGGAEIVMRDIVKYLHNKYDVTVMTLDNDIESAKKIFPNNVTFIPSKFQKTAYHKYNPRRYIAAVNNLIRKAYIQKQKYDIVIANKEGVCMKIVAKMSAEKKLAWVHADYRNAYWTHTVFSAEDEVKCMKRFDSVVCVSDATSESVKEVIGDPGNLCVKYNPIDFMQIKNNAQACTEIKRSNKKLLFVAVGRIVAHKNFLTLAKVCARLSKEFDFELWIVGDGEQRQEIESLLNKANCDCVKILGMQTNPYKYVVKADFLISTSLGESYGLVIQEALILGVPVMTTRCPAIEECFDTRFGLIVDCDEESIEKGMRNILENPDCVDAYRKTINAEYDAETLWEPRLQEIEKIIK